MNWFHNGRILRTSWTDMSPSGSYNFFSIDRLVFNLPCTVPYSIKVLSNKSLRYKQMEIFHQIFQYTLSNFSDFIELILLLQSMQLFFQLNVYK